ncbi:hypothetical protein [Peribacillus butanolivorans]|uniref:hypothetical protein n=1 Tax=Peribacillus butanolivorans TaxID=421767 RepID=UPI00167F46D6|nr:hypothetical protein [Peribacillus butanolivorans]QNU03905.1 hypothetical protein GM240_08095 [Peribacillus butanolivorans]
MMSLQPPDHRFSTTFAEVLDIFLGHDLAILNQNDFIKNFLENHSPSSDELSVELLLSFDELSVELLSFDELSVELLSFNVFSVELLSFEIAILLLASNSYLYFNDIRTAYICAFFLIGTLFNRPF